MPPDVGVVEYLPQQWLGAAAIIVFGLYVLGELVERFEWIAKRIPFGKWWHNRKRPASMTANDVAAAVTEARQKWEREGNDALKTLEDRVESIADLSQQQAGEIIELRRVMRAFTAWSAYDSRWHHRHEVDNTSIDGHIAMQHMDFFQFEKLFNDDPIAAAQLLR